MSQRDPYTYLRSSVLRNKLGIKDASALEGIERRLVAQRAAEGIPRGLFDLDHLRAIHRHLFQDLYEWAGEIRTVELSKGGQQFQFRQFIETGMSDVYRRLERENFLQGLSAADFAREAGKITGDVNYVHPFREGNGRAQLFYLEQLAEQAGHPLDLTQLDPQEWIKASRCAHEGDYTLMARQIARALQER